MTLGDAIRKGAMQRPQGFGVRAMRSREATCVLGAAVEGFYGYEAIGHMLYSHLMGDFPVLTRQAACPAGCAHLAGYDATRVYALAYHLNDRHRWSREAIADWVDSLDAEPAAGETPLALTWGGKR